MMDFRRSAEHYTEKKIPVLPIMRDKKPFCKAWAPFQTRLPSPAELDAWGKEFPSAGIALVTGKISDLTVVDTDTQEAVELIEDILPDSLEVPTVTTPRGGRHYYFRHTPELHSRNGAAPGIDIKSDGGYIITPPTRGYKAGGFKIEARPAMPQALVDFLKNGSEPGGGTQTEAQAPLTQGRRDADLFHLALQFFKDGHSRDDVERIVLDAARAAKPAFPEREARAKVASAWKRMQQMISGEGSGTLELEISPISGFHIKKTLYVVPDRIPAGMLTLVSGEGGVGKSTLLTAFICRISRGDSLPGSSVPLDPPGSTIYITTENQPEEVFKPRVLACEGDPSKIYYVRNVLLKTCDKADQPQIFDATRHLPVLSQNIQKIGDVRMVVIDPAISHISEKIDPNSSTQVRQVLDELSEFARRHEIAVVVVGHVSKGQAAAAIFKAAGSHQWVAAARVVLAIAKDKDDEMNTRRFLSCLKANIYITPRTLAFRIIDTHVEGLDESGKLISVRSARVEFEPDELDINIEEVFNPERLNESETAKAMRIISLALKDGPKPEAEVRKAIEEAGIKDGIYHSARRRMGVHSEKLGMDKGWQLWQRDHWTAYQEGVRK